MREFILATFLIFNGCTAPANKNDRDSSGVSTVDTTHPNKSIFYVDDFGSSEHDKIYGFKIVDGKVKIISVDEAG